MTSEESPSRPPTGVPKVSPVVGKLRQIEHVWQLEGDFHRLPLPVEQQPDAEFAIFRTGGALNDEGTQIVASVELGCRLTVAVADQATVPEEFLDKASGRVVVAFVRSSYMITYGLDDGSGLSPDDVADFCATNGVHTAWPFWREFVTSSLTRSGLGAVPVPPFTIYGRPNAAASQ